MGRVVIRTKKKCHGTMLSVYLEFCPPFTDNSGKQVRYEFLDLEKYTTPANDAQRKFNATIDDIADAIRCERYISLVHKDYEFLSKRRINEDFLEYFHRNIVYRGIKFKVSLKYLHRFCKGKCSFKDVTVSFCERFKGFLTNTKGLHRRAKLRQNTASAYFNAFMSIVNLAHQDGIIKTDINTKISRIHWKHDTAKEYLDEKEIRRLERVEFTEYPDIQRACLLSIYTGLRRSDILALDWKCVHINSKKRSYLDIVISKTQVAVKLPLSPSAIELLGKPQKRGLVFPDLTSYKLSFYLPRPLQLAKIEKYITFHCFRHTFAMRLLENGVDIYTIATLLGHKSVTSTQVYARLSPTQIREAVMRL